jgi:lysophospholipase L1-like esterase
MRATHVSKAPTVAPLVASDRTKRLANVVLLAFSLALSMAALELMARFFFPAPLPWNYPQIRYRSDPALIFSLQPGQRGFSADKPVTINERGYRGADVPFDRTPGKRRVLFLGDSITFGYGVRDSEVVTERVRSLLRQQGVDVEIVNTAVPSYNTEQEVASFERDGQRYRPDWVVVGVCWNDINDKSDVRVNANGELVDAAAAGTESEATFASSPTGYALRNALKRSRLLYASMERWRAFSASRTPDEHMLFRMDVLNGRDTPRIAGGWQRMESAFRELHALTEKNGQRLLVVTFPIPLTLESDFSASSYPRRLTEFAAREGISFLDLTAAYRAAFSGHESLYIAYDGDHPNAAGHDVAAAEIARVLAPELR